jgi:hypothetical protein
MFQTQNVPTHRYSKMLIGNQSINENTTNTQYSTSKIIEVDSAEVSAEGYEAQASNRKRHAACLEDVTGPTKKSHKVPALDTKLVT